ncbi:hypothetical protein F5887DRAFT_168885 [Amanita rubescens]|nr:hypothetical protein F5887DRAFT_168885 [Amanita rubescens]
MIIKALCSCPNFILLSSANSNPMSQSTTSGSRPSRTRNTQNTETRARRIQREVLRHIPRNFLHRWGERIAGRGNFLTPNGPTELGIISMEGGRCSYRRIGSCSSSRFPSASPSPVQQTAPLPPTTATALDEPNAPFPPTLPLSLADASAIAHNGSAGSFIPQIEVNPPMDAGQHPHPAISHHGLQNLSYQPGVFVHQGLPSYFYTYNYSTASSVHGSSVGDISPAAMDHQPWASSPESTFAGSHDGGFTSPSYASGSSGDWSPTPSHGTHEGAYDGYLAAGGSHLEGPSTQRR